jgi:pyruvate/2-oxoglutarate/acetoin dehydrogenase E1 component
MPDFSLQTIVQPEAPDAPFYLAAIQGAPPAQMTITAYGYAGELARQAALNLAYQHEVFAELIIPTQLSPFAVDPILESVSRTKNLLVIEEGGFSLGWGAEVLARAIEKSGLRLRRARRCAARDLPIPASGPLEQVVLPSQEDIVQAALGLLRNN